MLNVQNLQKLFNGSEHAILQGVNLQAGHGESVAITGASGCGKSTLLAIIAGLTNANSGSVSINGQPLPAGNAKQADQFRRAQLGLGEPDLAAQLLGQATGQDVHGALGPGIVDVLEG